MQRLAFWRAWQQEHSDSVPGLANCSVTAMPHTEVFTAEGLEENTIFLPQPPDSLARGKRKVWASLMSPPSSISSSLVNVLAVHETQLEVA